MRKPVWEKRIPTLLGLLFIVVAIVITSYLVKTGTNLISKASPSSVPENIRITNISSTSFSVSYVTTKAVTGVVSFGQDKTLGQTALDDRDQKSGTPNMYNTHHITIKNLKPKNQYFFSIVSGQDSFLNNNAPFEVETGNVISQEPPAQKPLSGKIILPDGGIPKESLIYVTTPNAENLSTIIKDNGSYILPLNSMLTSSLSSYVFLSENTRLTMLISTDSLSSTVSLLPTQIDPVPTITLSQNYDFTQGNAPSLPEEASPSGSVEFPSLSANVSKTNEAQITTPKENEKFADQKPFFKGTASPNSDVSITINSENIIETVVQANTNGNWTYRPNKELPPGNHTISITTRDNFGILKTITKTFTVYAAGTQLEGAIPSGTPTPTPPPAGGPTPQPLPTATPTPTPIPTIEPSPTPTTIPKPTSITTKGGISSPGSSAATILGIIALGTTATGALLVLLGRKVFL